ncbi:hypothetical protein LXA43DRAFT_180910 [Ganoderma leucocontextum]|nr:hypothetical protein LXA43DRAFT_180910 [Ganoderma leucocontextum]
MQKYNARLHSLHSWPGASLKYLYARGHTSRQLAPADAPRISGFHRCYVMVCYRLTVTLSYASIKRYFHLHQGLMRTTHLGFTLQLHLRTAETSPPPSRQSQHRLGRVQSSAPPDAHLRLYLPFTARTDGCHRSSSLRRVGVPDLHPSASPNRASRAPLSLPSFTKLSIPQVFPNLGREIHSVPTIAFSPLPLVPIPWYFLSPMLELRAHYITSSIAP